MIPRIRPPDIAGGSILDQDRFAILDPIARTNEVVNPSYETSLTGCTAGAGTLARTTEAQYYGAYSAKYTPSAAVTDGWYYGTIAMTVGQLRAIHVQFKGVAGIPYALTVATTGGVDLALKPFVASGVWEWIILYYGETASASRRIYVRKHGHASVQPYYVDGMQSEVIQPGELASTYIDGDQRGYRIGSELPAYGWTGTPHASTSYRSAQTRAGGMVIDMRTIPYLLTAIVGLGMAVPQLIANDYAVLDGAAHQRTRMPSREFSLIGRFDGVDSAHVSRAVSRLAALLDRDRMADDQPLTLLYQRVSGQTPVRSSARIVAHYRGGLEGNRESPIAEKAPLNFTMFVPYVQADGEQGATLNVQTSVVNANRVLLRSPAGVWSALATGAAGGSVYAVARGQDGKLYIGGDFASFGGVANTARICSYDPATGAVAALGTGSASGAVWRIEIGPDGAVWPVGTFQNMGGVAAADYVATWNPTTSTWAAPGTPPVLAGNILVPPGAAFGADGSLFVTDATLGGKVWKWDGATWTTIWTVGGAAPFGLTRAPNGDIIIGIGTPIAIGGTTTTVARWDGAAITAVGANTTGVIGLTYDAAGNLYAVGATALKRYNGVAWTSLVTFNAGTVHVTTLPDGSGVYVTGIFITANGLTLPDSLALVRGDTVVLADVDLPGTAGVNYVTLARALPDGSLIVGFDASGTASAAATTTIRNSGSGRSWPTITLRGPTSGTGRVYSIINRTTGRALYLNYTMAVGETATFVCDPRQLAFTSDFQGNLMRFVVQGSNEADMFLAPGDNSISMLTTAGTMTATIVWRPTYVGGIRELP